ncbi:Bug family tripartite tricarboxylate transporter substrate binding protein [Allopusillimonas ginsengisoli]|uniref:Bug family tripartite tricarboxylate transporter substrate binding protein n=1 Tax=Allopusillimonas ginsengisoli TaxID=453575 RepID=UPI0010211F75|nr:tripartite tricarboxylate transporter substrate binding protein [Allopusillimonas ginsengisoli]TEA78904.1 tripartite tricarboxylate transporter substrate binding protein [Allopusillimonas ginsengisoli]
MHTSFHKPFIRSVSLGIAALALSTGAQAASFPEHAITLIVPYPPAGTTDIAARTIAHAMEGVLGQSVVVENRAGAGGSIGMGQLARAKPDGYTLGMGTIGTQSINQFLYPDMPFDPEKDFAPIALVLTTPNVIAVNAQSEIKTMDDLIAAAKSAKDKKLSYASPGVGSSVHLTGAYLEQEAGIDMLHIPYKGASQSLPALIGGQVDILLDNLPSTLAQIKDGSKIRGIAITSAERSPSVPNIPTVAESGLKNVDVTAWFALYAPTGTPPDILDKLTAAAKQALASPEVQAKFVSLGAEAGTLTGSELSAFEAKERARWSKLIQDRNIQRQ